jgi:uncharacterized protein YjiS (DUF1127 family)
MGISRQFQRWRRTRRYRTTVRQLRSLPPQDLRALGVPPGDIERLACAAAQ